MGGFKGWFERKPTEFIGHGGGEASFVSRAVEGSNRPDGAEEEEPEVDLEALREEAYEAGLAEGQKEAEALKDELAKQQAGIDELVESLSAAHGQALQEAADGVAEMVLKLTERVLGASLALHPQALETLVREAISAMPAEETVEVRVPPDRVDEVSAMVQGRGQVKVIGDESITGGCRASTSTVTIESTVAAVIEGLEKAVDQWKTER